jgi:NADH-quinone oxidoreductase subunit M
MTVWNGLPTWVTFSPLLGMLVLLFIPRQQNQWLKWVGMAGTLPPLILALTMFAQFDPQTQGVQFAQNVSWIHIPLPQSSGWTLSYAMGADGLSIPFVVMTTIIAALAAVGSMYIKERLKSYFLLFLLLEIGMLGVFLARDLFLFFLFFEVTLVATFFLVGIWGYMERERAANQFLLYNGLGSALMLLAFVGLMFVFGTLNLDQLLVRTSQLFAHPEWIQGPAKPVIWGIFLCILVAFGIKLPAFPFHTWMLRVHVEAPPAVVMIHSGVLLKMGAYGLIRFGVDLFPPLVHQMATFLAVLGLVNILYGAALAFVQRDLKRVLAYSSVSHMGIILFGIAALNFSGLQGAVFQAVSHGFISALMFLIVAALYERTGTTMIDEMSGLAKAMPVLSGVLLAGGLALLGLPGMSGFVSEFLAFLGMFKQNPVIAGIGALGLILAAAYTLRAVMAASFGPFLDRWERLTDTKAVETVPMLVLLGMIIAIGVYPQMLGEPMQTTLQMIVNRIGG